MIKNRLTRLRRLLVEQEVDALLVTMPANRRWLSGYTCDDGQFGESSGALFIAPTGAHVLTDFRYELTARSQAEFFQAVIYERGLPQVLPALCAEHRVRRLAVEADGLMLRDFKRIEEALPQVELVPTGGLVASLRVAKDRFELVELVASLRVIEDVLDQVLATDIVGKTERELALAIIRGVEDAGAEGVSFAPIVAAGPSGAEPHAEPDNKVIQRGQPVIFDVGAKLDGYCSDITRTVVAGGLEAADDTFRKIYPIVRQAQLTAQEGILPGMTASEADALAREVIAEAGYGPRFGHSLGHGIGLMTHEAPSLSPRSDQILEPGMVFTIEPGIYLPGWGGIRLENMAVITEDGCRVLNQLDRFYAL